MHDGRVRVDDGLNLGRRVDLVAANVRVVEHAVDHRQRRLACASNARDAQRFVLRNARGGVVGRVALCRCADQVQRAHRVVDDGLQTAQAVELIDVVGNLECLLEAGNVVCRHPRHAQQLQVRHAGVPVHHVLHRIGQRLDFVHRVDCGRIGGHAIATGGVQHVAQQARFLGGVDAAHTKGAVVRGQRVDRVVVGCAVGALHDGRVRVDDALNQRLGAGIGPCHILVCQGAVDHGHRWLTRAVHAGDAELSQVSRYGCITPVVLCEVSDFGQ